MAINSNLVPAVSNDDFDRLIANGITLCLGREMNEEEATRLATARRKNYLLRIAIEHVIGRDVTESEMAELHKIQPSKIVRHDVPGQSK